MNLIKWIVLGACIYLGLTKIGLAVPLQTWTDWSTNQPYVSKQVPPNALVARCKDDDTYCVVEIDQATGELPVALSGTSISIDFSGPTGDPVPADAGFVGGVDGSGDLRGLSVDTDGRLQIDATTDNDFAGTPGSAVPADAGFMGGTDGTNLRGLKTDSGGELQVDVLSSALPSGAATAANQSTEIGHLSQIEAAVEGTLAVSAASLPLPAGAATEAKQPALGTAGTASSDVITVQGIASMTPLSVSQSGAWSVTASATDLDIRALDDAVDYVRIGDGTDRVDVTAAGELEVSLTTALPAGNNNVGDVDVATIAAGNNNIGDVDVASIAAGNNNIGDVDVASIAAGNNNIGDVDVTNFPATVSTNAGASDASTLRVTQASRSYADSARLVYSSTNVTTGAWVELDSSTAGDFNCLTIFDSSGQTLELGVGAAAAESRVMIIPPGGHDGCIPLRIASGSRLSLKAISGTASSGEINITGLN